MTTPEEWLFAFLTGVAVGVALFSMLSVWLDAFLTRRSAKKLSDDLRRSMTPRALHPRNHAPTTTIGVRNGNP